MGTGWRSPPQERAFGRIRDTIRIRSGVRWAGRSRRNKLFYYVLYQYNPLGQAGTPSSAILSPTAAGYSQLASIPGVSQTNVNILKQYLAPAPSASGATTVSGVAIPIGTTPITKPSFTNTHSW